MTYNWVVVMPRKKLNKVSSHFRVEESTPTELSRIAVTLGYIYGTGGAVGEMLDAIASGRLLIIPKENWDKVAKKIDHKTGI